jgi:hypothetical protein
MVNFIDNKSIIHVVIKTSKIYSVPHPTLVSTLPLLGGFGLVGSLGTPRTSDVTNKRLDIFIELFELTGMGGKVEFVSGHLGESTRFLFVDLFVEFDVIHDGLFEVQPLHA